MVHLTNSKGFSDAVQIAGCLPMVNLENGGQGPGRAYRLQHFGHCKLGVAWALLCTSLLGAVGVFLNQKFDSNAF